MIFEKDTLKGFLHSFFNAHHCTITSSGGEDLWDVNIPEEKRSYFDGASILHLCFDRELLTLHSDYAFVTTGAPLFNQIKEAYSDERLYTTGFISVSEEQARKWAIIPPRISFIKCMPNLRESIMAMRPLVRFNFKLTITGDEKMEEIFPILIDGTTVKMANPLLIKLKDSVICDTAPAAATLLPIRPLQELKKKACEVAAIKVRPLMEHLQSVNRKKMDTEIAAALLFYQREYESLAKEKDSHQDDFEKNREKEVEEIRERYRLSLELSLQSVMCCYAPLLKNMIDVEAGGHSFSLSVDCDLLQERTDDPLCPKCGAPFREIHCCADHGLLCPDEIWVCQSCHNDQCNQCIKTICSDSSCWKTICGECAHTCPRCSTIVCREHRRSCSQCGKEGCTICIIPDDRDGAILCSDCSTLCTSCQKRVIKTSMRKCSRCGTTVCPSCLVSCTICHQEVCLRHSHSLQGGESYICTECGGSCSCCKGFFPKEELIQCTMDGKLTCKACATGSCCASGCTMKSLCKSHGKPCRTCNQIFCPDHLPTCPICKGQVCTGDSEQCSQCGRIYCREHFLQCISCGKRLCPHCSPGTFVQCSRDKKVLCGDHAIICSIERKVVCPEHTGRCSVCGNQSCKEHFKYCNKCGDTLCPTCQSRCVTCSTVYCPGHAKHCPACGNDFCVKHQKICAGCGVELCVQCLDAGKTLCDACSSLSPLAAQSLALGDFLKAQHSAFPEIGRIAHWRYSTSGDYEVFRGTTSTWSITFSVRKGKRGQILSYRRGGLGETIKWFFGA